MNHQFVITSAITALLLSGGVAACVAQTAPTTAPAAPAAAQKAGQNVSQDAGVDDLLDALDHAGEDLSSLSANVILTDFDNDTGAETQRPGRVYLRQDEQDVRFRAVFPGPLVNDDPERPQIRPEKIEYLLRGDELIDRNYKTKTQVTRKLPPEQQKLDLLKLGEGPFPLPIGQDKEDVRRQFEVREVDPSDPAQNEMDIPAPPNTRRLRLTPREGTALADDFSWIEIDVALDTGLPRTVLTLDRIGTSLRVTDLRKLEVNPDLPADAFEMEAVDLSGWNVIYEEL